MSQAVSTVWSGNGHSEQVEEQHDADGNCRLKTENCPSSNDHNPCSSAEGRPGGGACLAGTDPCWIRTTGPITPTNIGAGASIAACAASCRVRLRKKATAMIGQSHKADIAAPESTQKTTPVMQPVRAVLTNGRRIT